MRSFDTTFTPPPPSANSIQEHLNTASVIVSTTAATQIPAAVRSSSASTSITPSRVRNQVQSTTSSDDMQTGSNQSLQSQESPSYHLLFSIIRKYFKSDSVSKTIAKKIDNLEVNESIHLSYIISNAEAKARPNPDERTAMLEELNQTSLFEVSRPTVKRVILKRISN